MLISLIFVFTGIFLAVFLLSILHGEARYKNAIKHGFKTKGKVLKIEEKWKDINGEFSKYYFPVIQYSNEEDTVKEELFEYGTTELSKHTIGDQIDLVIQDNNTFIIGALKSSKKIKRIVQIGLIFCLIGACVSGILFA